MKHICSQSVKIFEPKDYLYSDTDCQYSLIQQVGRVKRAINGNLWKDYLSLGDMNILLLKRSLRIMLNNTLEVIILFNPSQSLIFLLDIPKEDLLQYRGIITVSGDGLPHEVLNGILGRSDSQEILQHITLGVLQGGSGNGLISSILTNC